MKASVTLTTLARTLSEGSASWSTQPPAYRHLPSSGSFRLMASLRGPTHVYLVGLTPLAMAINRLVSATYLVAGQT